MKRSSRLAWVLPVAVVLSTAATPAVSDQPDTKTLDASAGLSATTPLHQQIDRIVANAHVGPLAGTATDSEFLRRVYLDLIGRTPTLDERQQFVDDPSENKRASVIDQLLDSPEFVSHFARYLDVMLMERRSGSRIAQSDWMAFLETTLSERWPLDRLVATIVSADGQGPYRAAAKFFLDRDVEPNAVTRDVGRIFLGRDLQCAQCHDHPNILDYEQSEYYGIYSFVQRSYLFEDPAAKKKPYVGEKAEGDSEFKSVFDPDGESEASKPHLLGGLDLDAEPRWEGDDPYLVAPSKTTAGVPKFSRRAQLARLLTHPGNTHFAENIANRLWAKMMGQGLVEPVDFHHSDNPPTHPELLDQLAYYLVQSQFDLRSMLRQIAMSQTYQRSIELPSELPVTIADVEKKIEQFSQLLDDEPSVITELGPARERLDAFRDRLKDLDDQISKLGAELAALEKQKQQLDKRLADASKAKASLSSQLAALQAAQKAAKTAAESFKGDKALGEATGLYQNRLSKIEQSLAQNKQAVEKDTAELTRIESESQAKRIQLGRLRGTRMGVVDMVAEARGAVVWLQRQERARMVELAEIRQRRAALNTLKTYLAAMNHRTEIDQQIARVSRQIEAQQSIEKSLAQKTQQLRDQLDSQKQLAAELEAQQATDRNDLQIRVAALESLAQAVAGAESAAASLDDPELSAPLSQLRQRHASLQSEIGQREQAVEQRQDERATLERRIATLLADWKQASTDLQQAAEQTASLGDQLQSDRQARATAVIEESLAKEALSQSWVRRYAVRQVIPLTAEQLAGSTISALGLTSRFQAEAESEWAGKNKDKKPEQIDAKVKAAEIASLVRKRIDAVHNVYVALFAAPAGAPQDVFSATADQALFFANDGKIQDWLRPAKGTLAEQLRSIDDPELVAITAYRSILCRDPSETERKQVDVYLKNRKEGRDKVINEIVWGLMSSAEFRFNH